MLSIKEFSELTGIAQSKLRYYDEIELFQPIKRGENGYRYYSAPQTVAVNCINVMHSMGIPVKKFTEFDEERTPEQILELLYKHELELNQELLRLQQAYSIIHTYSGLIREGLFADEHTIIKRWMPAVSIELGAADDFSDGFFYESFFKFLDKMSERRINPAYPAGGYYDNIDSFVERPGQPNRFFLHIPTGKDVKEAGEYLVGHTRGYYGRVGDLPLRLQEYAKENGVAITGPVYEMYLHDEITVGDPDQYLIRASVLIDKSENSRNRRNRPPTLPWR